MKTAASVAVVAITAKNTSWVQALRLRADRSLVAAADDVFKHHDGIVDDKARREHHGQKR